MRNLVIAKIKEIAPYVFSYAVDAFACSPTFEEWSKPFIKEEEDNWELPMSSERKAKRKEIADRQTASFVAMLDGLSDEVLLRTLVEIVDFKAFANYH